MFSRFKVPLKNLILCEKTLLCIKTLVNFKGTKTSLQRAQYLGISNILFNLTLSLIISCHEAENTVFTEVFRDSIHKEQLMLYIVILKMTGKFISNCDRRRDDTPQVPCVCHAEYRNTTPYHCYRTSRVVEPPTCLAQPCFISDPSPRYLLAPLSGAGLILPAEQWGEEMRAA